MPIDIQCSGCQAGFQVPDRLAGKLIRCTSCRKEFRVGGDEPADNYFDEPPPRRRPANSSSSVLVPLLIVGGMFGLCVVGAAVVYVVVLRDPDPPRPFAQPQPVVVPQPQPRVRRVSPNAVLPRYTMLPPQPPAQLDRPEEPILDTIVVTLSDFRRVEGLSPEVPVYAVNYHWQDTLPKPGDRYRMVVKYRGGVSQHIINFDDRKEDGTVSFRFSAGTDPGPTIELWIEQKKLARTKWDYKQVSNVAIFK